MREIILDTETTGLYPDQGHRIVEIGCVEMINRSLTNNTMHFYINPERESDKDALKVHGLDQSFLSMQPKFEEIANKLIEFLGDAKIVAHNANFDVNFLNNEFDISGYSENKIREDRIIDTITLARKRFPGSPVNLDALCKRFNINLNERIKHGALIDANLLCKVYIELLGGKQREFNIETVLQNNKSIKNTNIQQKKKFESRDSILNLTKEDFKNHSNLLRTIKKPIWNKFLN